MKLLYATSITYPSKYANRFQVLKMSEAWYRLLGNKFILGGRNITSEQDTSWIVSLKISRSFLLAWRFLRLVKKQGITHIYSREERLLFFIMIYNSLFWKTPLSFAFEAHAVPDRKSFFYKFVMKRVSLIVALTSPMKTELEGLFPRQKIIVEPDAVDFDVFKSGVEKRGSLRSSLNISAEAFVLGYTGSFRTMGMEKGISNILKAGSVLIKESLPVFVVVVGATSEELVEYENIADKLAIKDNVRIITRVPWQELPGYQQTCDALLMPYPHTKYFDLYTSPMKLFEYMASGKPIIASDLPSIRDVLNNGNSLLIEPGSVDSLVDAVKTFMKDPSRGESIGKKSQADVAMYTWDKRALRVTSAISFDIDL